MTQFRFWQSKYSKWADGKSKIVLTGESSLTRVLLRNQLLSKFTNKHLNTRRKYQNEEICEVLDFIIYQNLSQNLFFKRPQKLKKALIKAESNHLSISPIKGIPYSWLLEARVINDKSQSHLIHCLLNNQKFLKAADAWLLMKPKLKSILIKPSRNTWKRRKR